MPHAKNRRDRETRRILIKMMLDLHALIRGNNDGSAKPRRVEEALVSFAVRLGQYEGRAMDVSAVSEVTRIPQASVSRHIIALRKKGELKSVKAGRRTLQYVPLAPENEGVSVFYLEVEQIVRRTCHDISKMDDSTTRHKT